MYYHLLDGDLASNFLSWQWVAGTSRQERYLANQENVNKFSKFHQEGTLIDRSYEELAEAKIPTELVEVASSELLPWVPPNEFSPLPSNEAGDSRVLLYLPWTLDPEWRKEERGARVVWFDAELFVRFPVSPLRGTFVNSLKLALPGQTRWFVGTKAELFATLSGRTVLARAHPLLPEWVPGPDSSEMLFKNVPHNGGSFMSFWKRCEAQLRSTGGV
jgi:deoxyribodipyrimidine photo-lyase